MAAFGIGLAAVVVACGSSASLLRDGGTGRLTQTSPTLSGGMHYDRHTIRLDRSALIHVTMSRTSSNSVRDPFIQIHRTGTDAPFDVDDDGGGGLDAALHFNAVANTSYDVVFTTLGADDTGSYVWSIEEVNVRRAVAARETDVRAKPGGVSISSRVLPAR